MNEEYKEKLLNKETDIIEKKIGKVEDEIAKHDGNKPNPNSIAEVKKYNREADALDAKRAKLESELEGLERAKNDPNLARQLLQKKEKEYGEMLKLYLDSKEKLQSKIKNNTALIAPHFRGMRDRCKDLAGNSNFNQEELRAKCGIFFDKNNSFRKRLDDMGIDPIPTPKGFQSVTEPIKWGKPNADFKPSGDEQGGFGAGSGVPSVGPSSPIDPKTGLPIDIGDDDND